MPTLRVYTEKGSNVHSNRDACFNRRAFIKRVAGGVILTAAASSLAGVATSCAALGDAVGAHREFTDDMGRKLVLPHPNSLKSIYFTSGLAEIFCYTLNPDLLAGTALQFSPQQRQFLDPRVADLPIMGSLTDNGQINRELLIAEHVQMVFSISAIGLTQGNLSDAEKLQRSTRIPVVLLDGSMDKIADCYRKLGYLLGKEEQAARLAQYCERVYHDVTQAVSTIPADKRTRVYYAEGPAGLQTEPEESQHALVFSLAGAHNVAKTDTLKGVGMSNVSLEQVLAWAPELIVTWDFDVMGGADGLIQTHPNWKRIPAVQNNRVYAMPCLPFAWLDRPPGVNRFLGLQWLAHLLYPRAYDVDMIQVTQEFYSLFYHVTITPDEVKHILGNSYNADR